MSTICFYKHSFSLIQKVSKTFFFMAHNCVYHISITVQNDEMQDCTFHCIHSGPQLIILHKSLHNWRSTFSKLQIVVWNMKIETIYWFISCMVWFDTILVALIDNKMQLIITQMLKFKQNMLRCDFDDLK